MSSKRDQHDVRRRLLVAAHAVAGIDRGQLDALERTRDLRGTAGWPTAPNAAISSRSARSRRVRVLPPREALTKSRKRSNQAGRSPWTRLAVATMLVITAASGGMSTTIRSLLNASWAKTRYSAAATNPAKSATNGPQRRANSGGMRASTTIATQTAQAGASRSGKSASAVAIDAARISGPAMPVPAGVS